MQFLNVKDFSCIRSAALELRPITLLIGPQASGKSVLTKLFYFFTNLWNRQFSSAEEGENLRLFKRSVAKEFSEWFPPSAWGRRPFEITFQAGEMRCSISRRANSRKIYDEVVVEFSAFFAEQYEAVLQGYRLANRRKKSEDDFTLHSSDETWRVRSNAYKYLRQSLKDDFVGFQLFVPAGRSFFTNLGKAFAMLEHGSQIDEITKRFGRLFSDLLDGENFYYIDKPSNRAKDFLMSQKREIARIFGGEIKLSTNDRHVNTTDGRKIPLSVLSSGQQELLPLLLFVQHYTRLMTIERDRSPSILYIEEPEAHLFPSSQGALASHLAAVSNYAGPLSNMLITTHSPYVLSTFNTLIKAHTVATTGGERAASKVRKVVPESWWIAPAKLAAYGLEDGELRSLKDDEGLILGEYLDKISEEISASFMDLLEIESSGDQAVVH